MAIALTKVMSVSRGLVAATLVALGLGPARAEDLAEIRARGTLRVVFGSYGMREAISVTPGTPPGLEREMIEGFAALHRLKVEFVAVATSGERVPALLAGRGTCSRAA